MEADRAARALKPHGLPVHALQFEMRLHRLRPRFSTRAHGDDLQRQFLPGAQHLGSLAQPQIKIRAVPEKLRPPRQGLLVEIGHLDQQRHRAGLRRDRIDRQIGRDDKVAGTGEQTLARQRQRGGSASKSKTGVCAFEVEPLETFRSEIPVLRLQRPFHLRPGKALAKVIARGDRHLDFFARRVGGLGFQSDLEGAGLEILHLEWVRVILPAQVQPRVK